MLSRRLGESASKHKHCRLSMGLASLHNQEYSWPISAKSTKIALPRALLLFGPYKHVDAGQP